jgi:cyclopropane-fatty-acyl-phospholipid synthase
VRLIAGMLSRLVKEPRIEVVFPDGSLQSVGCGDAPALRMRIVDGRRKLKLALNPELALGEAVMDGRVVVERGSLYDLLDVLIAGAHQRRHRPGRGRCRASAHRGPALHQHNTLAWARRNVAHHYDLKSDFFRLFLDEDMQYSCAYFPHPGTTLEEAQQTKKHRLVAKLAIEPGQRVLDIGCGWGGLGLTDRRRIRARTVTGITLSQEQLAIAQERAAASVAGRVPLAGLPHHGRLVRPHRLGRYVRACRRRLLSRASISARSPNFSRRDGVALVHTIGRSSPPGATNPFIAKYIFPGGYIPAMSEVTAAIEREGLIITDVEVLRLHYAETLKAWRERFLARRSEVVAMYDERFARMWEFYLASCEASFRHDDLVVFQFQLAKRLDTLPMTRSYMSG